MKKGFKQTKTPTKKESKKMKKTLMIGILDKLIGEVHESCEKYEGDYVPLNLLGDMFKRLRYKDDDMIDHKEEKAAWNNMLYKIMETAEVYCKKNFTQERLPMDVFDELIEFYITAIKEA